MLLDSFLAEKGYWVHTGNHIATQRNLHTLVDITDYSYKYIHVCVHVYNLAATIWIRFIHTYPCSISQAFLTYIETKA